MENSNGPPHNLPVPLNGRGDGPHEPLTTSRRCTARSKTSGQQCKNPAVLPTDKCRIHGGLSLRGVAHPQYKNGAHSKYLPRHLRRDYQRAIKDPELLSLRNQVALLAAREMELAKELSKTEAPPWEQAVDRLVDVENAVTTGDPEVTWETLASLAHLLRTGADQGAKYAAVWTELREVIQERAKLTVAEQKRLESLGAM